MSWQVINKVTINLTTLNEQIDKLDLQEYR